VGMLVDDGERSPKCPTCGHRTAWLKEIPVKGSIKNVCINCKRAFKKRLNMDEAILQKILGRIRRVTSPNT